MGAVASNSHLSDSEMWSMQSVLNTGWKKNYISLINISVETEFYNLNKIKVIYSIFDSSFELKKESLK